MRMSPQKIATTNEYLFLERASEGLSSREVLAASDTCFSKGFIDGYGNVTLKGKRGLFYYRKEQYG